MTNWRPLFGHDTPYENQIEGIETVIDSLESGGFVALEGACGTGKTMLALTAAMSAVVDESQPFERVFVITSVKQQLRQFEADLERMHRGWPSASDPFGAITLVGKGDVCPYNLTETGGMARGPLYERCENLRDRTRELIDEGQPPNELAAQARSIPGTFDVNGESSPYPPEMARTNASGAVGEVEYCPFYAQYLADAPVDGSPAEAIPFGYREDGPLTPEALIDRGLDHGSCPHSLMGAILQDAEVVIGNYYHAFDRRTVAAFTGPLFDESTIIICDEAHMLEDRVRSLASESLALNTIERAQDELAEVIECAKGRNSRGAQEVATAALTDANIDRANLSLVHTFLGAVIEAIESIIGEHAPDVDDTVTLRDPETVEIDRLTAAIDEEGYEEPAWRAVEMIGPVVERVLNAVDGEERWRATPAVGRFLSQWYAVDHETYFRSIELHPRDRSLDRSGWRADATAHIQLHNCLPSDVIADVLDSFGGGVLMSATLAPLEVFAEVAGLTRLDRPVESVRYGLPFPPHNRLDMIVDAPKFTYRNRGAPHEETPTRAIYADTIATIATSPGNVLVGMPSYAEARWAASALESRIDRPVLLDQSSDRETTDALKSSFFAGPEKVLVTSLRGTLTEGVDYAGDRLAAAVVCGVPIINTGDPVTKAMQTAYDRRFDDGFDHALVVPAVRKARQALGRVIRGHDEVGVRALIDGRYLRTGWDGVADRLPNDSTFEPIDPDEVGDRVDQFWASQDGVTST